MRYTDEELEKLSVHELTKLVNVAAKEVVAEARKLLDSKTDPDDKNTAMRLYYLVVEPAAKIDRRVFYTRGKNLPNTGHLRYEARCILMEQVQWQSKVGCMIDYFTEIDRIMEQAGLNTWPAKG